MGKDLTTCGLTQETIKTLNRFNASDAVERVRLFHRRPTFLNLRKGMIFERLPKLQKAPAVLPVRYSSDEKSSSINSNGYASAR